MREVGEKAVRSGPARRFVPPNLQDPFGLAWRILRSQDRAAWFSAGTAALSAVTIPLDLALEPFERRLYRQAQVPTRPIVLVTGPPRSGTTIVAQMLCHHLPVIYFNNLTALFPRSPIMANRVFGRRLRPPRTIDRSYYGRTAGLAGSNDGLHLWDRWMGHDRYVVPTRLAPEAADAMVRFFGAYEHAFGRPMVIKNNALATGAALIARTLPTVHVLFVRRQAALNVQSVLRAREVLQGTRDRPYGVGDPQRRAGGPGGPIEDVCAQVLYHEREGAQQRAAIGARRAWVVDYEDVCRAPDALVARVATDILDLRVDRAALRQALPPLPVSERVTNPAEFAEIEATLAYLSAGDRRANRA
jgi:hypothetical protein